MNYYNEHDPKAAAWLRELIKGGHIPAGDVDERSITEIKPHELQQYTQCHFFAGIGGWSLALQLAGWDSTRPVGTGSCPCQPFSSAGKQLGEADERHLWPVFFNLIIGCRALGQQWAFTVFGEQVANAIGKGWLDGISTDLESEGYACGAVVLGAHSVGAPHIRQRLYWVAVSESQQPHRSREPWGGWGQSSNSSDICGMAHTDSNGCHQGGRSEPTTGDDGTFGNGGTGRMADTSDMRGTEQRDESREGSRRSTRQDDASECAGSGGLGNSLESRLEGHTGDGDHGNQPGRDGADPVGSTSTTSSARHWDNFDILPCTDGKARRIESGTFPLAHGVPGRVGLLRGYGNAIVPEVAAEFIIAFNESR